MSRPTNVTKETMIAKLREMTERTGEVPTGPQFGKEVTGAKHHYTKLFGSYVNMVVEAGFSEAIGNGNKRKVSSMVSPEITRPLIPDDDISPGELIEIMKKRFSKRHEAHTAKKWMEFGVNTDSPIGICWFGDPHIDDDGCNWPLLVNDINIVKSTEGLYGANIGDTTNNWVGRLMAEYANQMVTRKDSWKLIEWLFKESGVKWLIWLLGNHDAWNFGGETMSKIVQHTCEMVDWRAQFKLKFSNGRECLIDAAHDHSGHSQWNSLHGQQKASTMGGVAHLYIAGHKHNWALAQNECAHTHRVYWLARARGYKHMDDYGEKLGFGSQKNGSSIVSVIDPKASDVNMVRCFADVKEGAEYLTWLRSKK